MSRFWIILAIVVAILVGLFVATKPKDQTNDKFTGDAAQIQADDHVRNGKDHKVTLIEYGDFQCPACGSYYPILKQLEDQYKDTVTFVFRNFPLITIHPNAFSAARAAEAANLQGKYWQMHDKLYETQQTWGNVSSNQQTLFEEYARQLNLNMTQFTQDYASEAVANRINRDVDSGKKFDITSTPTFILNGQKIENPRGLEAFKNVLDKAVKQATNKPSTATEDKK